MSDGGDRPPGASRRTIVLDLHGDARAEGWVHPFAGGWLWCDERLPGLRPVRQARPRPTAAAREREEIQDLVYDGEGSIDGSIQRVRSLVGTRGGRFVEMADGETFRIDAEGECVVRVVSPGEGLTTNTIERALGAPLALALALSETYVLHASAIAAERGVIALVGESGAGKSTLAAAAEVERDLALHRVADDQLSVRFGRVAFALPHFPQLKLAPAEAYSSTAPPVLPLLAVMVLERLPAALVGPSVEIDRLAPIEAGLVLVRSTVAGRLFDRVVLAQHFAACTCAGGHLPVFRLRYPDELDRMREPLQALRELASR